MTVASLLGPFIGYTDHSSAKIWMRCTYLDEAFLSLHGSPTLRDSDSLELEWNRPVNVERILFQEDRLKAGVAKFTGLDPDTLYFYKVWKDENLSERLDLQGLEDTDLHFRTLPENSPADRLDFLLMSCHNPTLSSNDGENGYNVWKHLPTILRHNEKVRFAILGGDQVYADDIADKVLKENNPEARIAAYCGIYEKFWSNIHYRRVLCAIPSVLMWDDHDIIDGWGSVDESYEKTKDESGELNFRPAWKALKDAATVAFRDMQAIRNPDPLSKNFASGFDSCFRIGRNGFVLADLRHNRDKNLGQIWCAQQFNAIKAWVAQERENIDTLFFLSTVTFAHADPKVEEKILNSWGSVLFCAKALKKLSTLCLYTPWPGLNLFGRFLRWFTKKFDHNFGDLRDDINDGWGAPVNIKEAQQALAYFFELQNPTDDSHPVTVVILSGDIHTAGYSTLYSRDPVHAKSPVIHHIVTSPVAYPPFPWIGEAIFRNGTKYVALGNTNTFGAQVSHHHCHRNVSVISLRQFPGNERFLKVKFYLENWPEPQIQIFDLDLKRTSHLENIPWRQQERRRTFFGRIKVYVILVFFVTMLVLGAVSLWDWVRQFISRLL